MRNEGRLDLGGTQAVAADIYHVIDTAHYPIVAVLVAAGAVTGKIKTWYLGPIGLTIALIVAPQGAEHGGPWVACDKVTALVYPHALTRLCDDIEQDPGDRPCRRTRRCRRRTGQWAYHYSAGLGLPP